MDVKNVAGSPASETFIEQGFTILTFINGNENNYQFIKEVDSSFIQFHFCLKGNAVFTFNNGAYKLPMPEDQSLLLYNPQRDLPMNLELSKDTWVVSLLVSIKKFHSLF